MEEISNKTIAALLVVAMVLSLSGTFFSLNKLNMLQQGVTGYATQYNDNATATLTLSSVTSIIFTTDAVDWGTISIDTAGGYTECNLTTEHYGASPAISGCSGIVTIPDSLVLENDGSVNVKVNITANDTPANWIGGTNPGFYFNSSENETGACAGTLVTTETALSTDEVTLCTNLTFDNTHDALNLDLKAQVPYDAPTGTKVVKITAYAEAI